LEQQNIVLEKQFIQKILPMAGFDPRITGYRSDHNSLKLTPTPALETNMQ